MICTVWEFWLHVLYLLDRFEVNFQDGLNCGGAYVKLLSSDANQDLVRAAQVHVYSYIYRVTYIVCIVIIDCPSPLYV